MEVSKSWKIVEFTKISIKMKNCNTFYKVQKTSRLNEIIQPPRTHLPSDKILLRLFSRRFTETNERLLSKYFKNAVFGVKKLWSANIFSDTKQKHVYWKFFSKLRKILTVLQDILFSMRVEVRKRSEVFWAKLYCKMSDLFR